MWLKPDVPSGTPAAAGGTALLVTSASAVLSGSRHMEEGSLIIYMQHTVVYV